MDLITHVSPEWSQPCFGGTSYSDLIKLEFGGSGNIAVGLSQLGCSVFFAGKAGQDLFSRLYSKNLQSNKVASKIFIDKGSPTGSVLVFVHGQNERSFLVFRGANDNLSTQDIDKVEENIRDSEYLYITGCSLVNKPQREAVLYAVELSQKYGRKIFFDPGAHNLIRKEPKLFAKIVAYSDVVTPNLDEAFALTNTSSLEDATYKLKSAAPLVVLKCGKSGCMLISDKRIVKVPGFKTNCLDPTGAGDAFASAMIYGLTHKLELEATCRIANWFASQVAAGQGARSFPSKSKIENFVESQAIF